MNKKLHLVFWGISLVLLFTLLDTVFVCKRSFSSYIIINAIELFVFSAGIYVGYVLKEFKRGIKKWQKDMGLVK